MRWHTEKHGGSAAQRFKNLLTRPTSRFEVKQAIAVGKKRALSIAW
jgi:hypothetical protein